MKNINFRQIKRRKIILLVLATYICHLHDFAFASQDSPREQIYEGVKKHLHQQLQNLNDDVNIVVEVNEIDSRISISSCNNGFIYSSTQKSFSSTYSTVKVTCEESDWYIFTSAKITKTKSVVVTSSLISPNTLLNSNNLKLENIDVNRVRHTPYKTIESLIGARLKHRAGPGQPIQSNMLCFVCKGDKVTISANIGTMLVKTSGIAKQDGIIGDTIRVENSSSKKLITAQVASAEEVIINL